MLYLDTLASQNWLQRIKRDDFDVTDKVRSGQAKNVERLKFRAKPNKNSQSNYWTIQIFLK